ncbi:MAG TPA: hypothetical protein VG433_11760, partial [Pirellulales bacterium]|nr:hypothetical protein [Pirellulales bacterium]
LGIGFSLWCRNSLRSMAATLGLALFAGGLYLPFILLILEFLLTPWGNQGVEWIVMIPCVPFLLAYPAVFWDGYLAGQQFDRTGMSVITFVMGLIGYGCFAALLWPALLGRFNQLVGRMTTDGRPWGGPTSRTHESEP